MQAEEIKALLMAGLADCDVEVSGEGNHFDISVVGDVFEGLNAVKKQQLVYSVINEHIASGTIHAVNMKTLTRAEAASLQ
jgi:acid stress-induced BolA-like protein IbaG/YrbA